MPIFEPVPFFIKYPDFMYWLKISALTLIFTNKYCYYLQLKKWHISLLKYALHPLPHFLNFSYHQSPMASIFMHWLVGMVYVFYFASFVILLREMLRPGVLWFLRNLNDPDFNPIQEMIHLSIARHLRRFCASLVMFGTSILVMLYLPSRIIKKSLPNFLPYQTATAGS